MPRLLQQGRCCSRCGPLGLGVLSVLGQQSGQPGWLFRRCWSHRRGRLRCSSGRSGSRSCPPLSRARRLLLWRAPAIRLYAQLGFASCGTGVSSRPCDGAQTAGTPVPRRRFAESGRRPARRCRPMARATRQHRARQVHRPARLRLCQVPLWRRPSRRGEPRGFWSDLDQCACRGCPGGLRCDPLVRGHLVDQRRLPFGPSGHPCWVPRARVAGRVPACCWRADGRSVQAAPGFRSAPPVRSVERAAGSARLRCAPPVRSRGSGTLGIW